MTKQSSAGSDIAALADRLWRVHPREIQDLGITRQQFYEREIRATFAAINGAAQPSQERKTFTVPPGYEAIRDDEGRATGEIRPKINTRCRKFGGNCVCQQDAECINARTIA